MSDQNTIATTAPASVSLATIAALNADMAAVQAVIDENLGSGGLSQFDLQRIKMPNADSPFYTITDLDGEIAVKEVRCVVLFQRDIRTYWRSSIDDTGGGSPPDCHSFDSKVGIGDPGGDCASCPLNQFGSAAKGTGKACKEVRQLFILREGSESVLPEVFSVPPTSLQAARKFALNLGGRGIPVSSVITEIGLAKKRSKGGQNYSQATFRVARALSAHEWAVAKQFAEMYKPLVAATINVNAEDLPKQEEEQAFN
jgi:hypothetical protein